MNKSIYTCNNCKKTISISDRFCYNCGVYLGEPAMSDEKGIMITSENQSNEDGKVDVVNKASRGVNGFIKSIFTIIVNPLYNIQTMPFRLGYVQTAALTLFYLAVQSALLVTFSMFVFDSPARLVRRFFNISLSYSPTTYMGLFINAISLSIVLMIILFSAIYLISSLVFNKYGKLMSLWNVVILSQIPNLLGLAILQLLWKINETFAIASVMVFFTVSTISIFKGTLGTLNGEESKMAYTVAYGYVFTYLSFIGCLKAFMG